MISDETYSQSIDWKYWPYFMVDISPGVSNQPLVIRAADGNRIIKRI